MVCEALLPMRRSGVAGPRAAPGRLFFAGQAATTPANTAASSTLRWPSEESGRVRGRTLVLACRRLSAPIGPLSPHHRRPHSWRAQTDPALPPLHTQGDTLGAVLPAVRGYLRFR